MKFGIIILFLLFSSLNLYSEIDVNITVPKLGNGMGEIEALLAANIGMAISELEVATEETLYKPELTSSFGTSSAISQLVLVHNKIPQTDRYSLSVGILSSAYSSTFDFKQISNKIDNLQPEDDFEIGVNAQLLNTTISIPNFSVSFSYINLSKNNFYFNNISGALHSSFSIFPDLSLSRSFSWNPLTVLGGLSVSSSSLGAGIETGVITESFELDPDGNGPLVSQSVDIELDPVINVGLDTLIGVINWGLGTGFNFLDFFHFYIGSGIYYSFGKTGISVSTNEDITVLGYLNGLIEEPGSISISGSIDGGSPNEFTGYIFTSMQYDISSMFFNLSALYHFTNGVGIGLSLGVFY